MNRIKILIIVLVFGAEFVYIALAAMAYRSEAANNALLHFTSFGMKIVLFPKDWWQKSASCSIGDVWEHSASATAAIETMRVSRLAKAGEIVQGLQKIETPSGTYWIVPTDYGALVDMLSDDGSDLYHAANRIGPSSVVLDCGASVGVFTRAALRRGAKIVVAIEPAAEPLRCLRRNLASEIAQGRVIVYPKGVWDKDAELALTTGDNLATSGRSVAIDRGKKGETIQLTTIDRLVQELHLPSVDFIKMDIEGAEPNALRGAAATLARYRPHLSISLEHRPSDPDTIPPLIRSLYPGAKMKPSSCVNLGIIQPNVVFVD